MNKKIFALFIVFIAAISVASVCAAELKAYDFDGKFTMDIPDNAEVKNMNETVIDSENEELGLLEIISWDVGENVRVSYYNLTIETVVAILNSGDVTFDEEYDNGLTILNNVDYKDNEGSHYYVGVSSDDKTVFVGCDNLNTAKEYVNSVVF